jgi:hypothetical protein
MDKSSTRFIGDVITRQQWHSESIASIKVGKWEPALQGKQFFRRNSANFFEIGDTRLPHHIGCKFICKKQALTLL